MKIGCKKDIGKIKKNDEDYYIVDDEIGLYLVADGVGGSNAGEVASKLGAETIREVIKEKLTTQNEQDKTPIIKEAVDLAHKKILDQASNEDHSGMGTTIVLSLYQNNVLYIAHVGDSRAYIINSRDMKRLTADHSVVGSLVAAGKISEKEARKHKMRNVITRCLGRNEYYFGPDIQSYPFGRGDILLLCSDGLTSMIEDYVINKVVSKKRGNLQNCADELVRLANKKGGYDNITVLLVENDLCAQNNEKTKGSK